MDPTIINRPYYTDKETVEPEPLRGTAFTEESGAHKFLIEGIDGDGETVALSGAVLGKFLRADNMTIDISGSIEDGAVALTLVGDCYNVPGRFNLAIYLSDGTNSKVIYDCVGSVYRATSGEELDSGTTVPSLQQLEAAYQNCVDIAEALPGVASVSETKTYLDIA